MTVWFEPRIARPRVRCRSPREAATCWSQLPAGGMLARVGASKVKRERAAREAAARARAAVNAEATKTAEPLASAADMRDSVSTTTSDGVGSRTSTQGRRPTPLELGIAAIASLSGSTLGMLWFGVLPQHPELLRQNWAGALVSSALFGGGIPVLTWIGVAAGLSARISGHGGRALPILVAAEILAMLAGLVWYLAVQVPA